MPWTPPPEEQLRALTRARRLNIAVLASFGVIVLAAAVTVSTDPDRWWVFSASGALVVVQGTLAVLRLRKIGAARSRIEAELHQAHTSSATPEGR